MIKTTTLTANIETAIITGGGHCIVQNRTGSALYASTKANIVADGEDVKYISDGASDIITGTNGKIYLLSPTGGKVQCEGTDYANQNFNKPSSGGGGGTVDTEARQAISTHEENSGIHVTSSDKTIISNSSTHIADTAKHVTAAEKASIATIANKLDKTGGTVTGATDTSVSQIRNISAGTATATTTNCPVGAIYGQYT